ncbi:hypothetical protein M3Y97_00828000 [Aphelenchoides bicaudatus]|nr:hypothetical protein M3Y97_00828000 [Aphelenchoides bicaudatus]
MLVLLYGKELTLVFCLSIAAYTVFVLLLFAVMKCAKPEWFANTSDNEVEGLEFGGFADFSYVYNCCPCNGISMRHCLNRIFPRTQFSIRRMANCECIRPVVQGNSPYNIDFICCRV